MKTEYSPTALFLILSLFLILILILSNEAIGQIAYVLREPSVGRAEGFYLPTAAYPTGSDASANPYVPLPNLPYFFSGAMPAGFGAGGHAIDEATMRVFSSDGRQVWEEDHELYDSTGLPLMPPVAGPQGLVYGGYTSFFPLIAAYSPMIMGLSIDSQSGTLWMCDRYGFQAFSSTHPYPATGPYISLPMGPFGQNWFTGIAFDSASDTLWLCDWSGRVHHVTTTGAVYGVLPATSTTQLMGITVNSGNQLASMGPPQCSTQLGGFRVIVTDGNVLCDPLTGATLPLAGSGTVYGLASCSDGQYSFGKSPANNSTLNITRPFLTDVGPVFLKLSGSLPNFPSFLLWGLCPDNPAAPIWGSGGFLRVSDGYVMLPTDNLGNAWLPLPAHVLPAGFQVTLQWIDHPPTMASYGATDALTLTLGLR